MTEAEKLTRGMLAAVAASHGIRLARIATSARVTGRAIATASMHAIAEAIERPSHWTRGRTTAYGYDAQGNHDEDGHNTRIIVTIENDPDQHCPVCGAVLVWGAGPACPNEPHEERQP